VRHLELTPWIARLLQAGHFPSMISEAKLTLSVADVLSAPTPGICAAHGPQCARALGGPKFRDARSMSASKGGDALPPALAEQFDDWGISPPERTGAFDRCHNPSVAKPLRTGSDFVQAKLLSSPNATRGRPLKLVGFAFPSICDQGVVPYGTVNNGPNALKLASIQKRRRACRNSLSTAFLLAVKSQPRCGVQNRLL
jgi:hypothetical protein